MARHPIISRTVLSVAAVFLLSTGCDRGSLPDHVGRSAPDFAITDSGRTIRLADYRGKVVVLSFWASWCPPCLEEFPSLIALQREMPQVVVLAVSFDKDDSDYRQYLVDNHIDLLTIRDASQKSNLAYGTTRPPETFIIDKNGILRRKFIGPQNWTNPEIVSYLNKL